MITKIKFSNNNYGNFSVFVLALAFSITACERSELPLKTDPQKQQSYTKDCTESTTKNNSGSTNEAIISDDDSFSLEEVEQRLLPLQTQITHLEKELETSRKASTTTINKMEDKQWDVQQLNDQVSSLQEANEDLQSQLKEQSTEIEILQDALKQQEINDKQSVVK